MSKYYTYYTGTLAEVPHVLHKGDRVRTSNGLITGRIVECLRWGTAAGYRVQYYVNGEAKTIDVDQRNLYKVTL